LNWFSLVGLYPLQTGENRLGHGSGYTIHIPELAQGAEALITLTGDEIWVEVGSHLRLMALLLLNASCAPITTKILTCWNALR